jgi:hypothetical protein
MRLSLPLAFLAAVLLAAWGLLAAPSFAMDHATHAQAAAASDADAPGHKDDGDRQDCCAVQGGMHCASAAGVLTEPLSADPVGTIASRSSRSGARPLFAHNPNPPAKPPRA